MKQTMTYEVIYNSDIMIRKSIMMQSCDIETFLKKFQSVLKEQCSAVSAFT